MSATLNKVQLIGILGKDPETRTMQSGTNVANLSVATSEKWRDKDSGENKEKTEWHRVTLWGKKADLAKTYLKKGSKVYIEGKLETREWTDKDGQKRYTTEIVVRDFGGALGMLDGRKKPDERGDASDGPSDDIPF